MHLHLSLNNHQQEDREEMEEQQHHQQLPCARCGSGDTKFCYYNNYSTAQPRYYCRTCNRYWTHGGALRDLPEGSGCRKSRKKATSSSSSLLSTSSVNALTAANHPRVQMANNPPPLYRGGGNWPWGTLRSERGGVAGELAAGLIRPNPIEVPLRNGINFQLQRPRSGSCTHQPLAQSANLQMMVQSEQGWVRKQQMTTSASAAVATYNAATVSVPPPAAAAYNAEMGIRTTAGTI